jgi:zinc transporter ZupT
MSLTDGLTSSEFGGSQGGVPDTEEEQKEEVESLPGVVVGTGLGGQYNILVGDDDPEDAPAAGSRQMDPMSGVLACGDLFRSAFSNLDKNKIKKVVMYTDAIAVGAMYYLLTLYGGNKVSDSKDGFPGVQDWDQVHKDALTNSFILLTVSANFWLAIGALKNILRIDLPELGSDPDAGLAVWQRRAVKTMSFISSATLALLFVASCDETIKEYDLPNWLVNVMYGMVSCVMATYTAFFYDDMKSIYRGLFNGDTKRFLSPANYKENLRRFLVGARVEHVLDAPLARARYAMNPAVSQSFDLSKLVTISQEKESLGKLANHRSVLYKLLVMGIFGYFDLGLLLSSVSNIKDGGRDMVSMMLMPFGKGPVHLNNNWNVGLEFTILPLILPAWVVFVKTALRGARSIKMYLGNQSNKFRLYGIGVLLSALFMTHVVADLGGDSPAQLGVTLGVMLLMSSFAYYQGASVKLLQRHAGNCLGMLSGMAFFAATYISVLKASNGSSCDHFDDQDDSCLAHVVDSAGTAVLGFLGPLGAGVMGLLMAGAFNVYAIDNAIDPNLNKISNEISKEVVGIILDNAGVVQEVLNIQVEGGEAAIGTFGAAADVHGGLNIQGDRPVNVVDAGLDVGLVRDNPRLYRTVQNFQDRVDAYSQENRSDRLRVALLTL